MFIDWFGIFFEIARAMLLFVENTIELFKILAGVTSIITADGQPMSILDYFLQSDTVYQVFWVMFLLAVFVAAMCVVVSVTKNIVNIKGGEQKSHLRTAGQGMGTIFVTMAFFAIIFASIAMSGSMLRIVNSSFPAYEDDSHLCNEIFNLCVEEVILLSDTPIYQKDEYGIDVLDEEGNPIVIGFEPVLDAQGNPIISSAWIADDKQVDLHNQGHVEIFGFQAITVAWWSWRPGKADALVDFKGFNLLNFFIASLGLFIAFVISLLALVRRLYDIIILLLIMPFAIATLPMDDGARFKAWRETMISKIILAFSITLSVNIFMLFITQVSGINIGGMDKSVAVLFKLFLFVGGALSIGGSQQLIARVLGTSAEESREMMQNMRMVMAGGALSSRVARLAGGTGLKAGQGASSIGKSGLKKFQSGIGGVATKNVGSALHAGAQLLTGNAVGATLTLNKQAQENTRRAIQGIMKKADTTKSVYKTGRRHSTANSLGYASKQHMKAEFNKAIKLGKLQDKEENLAITEKTFKNRGE